MYWWQKSAVGNNPSHSLSDDEYSVADSDDLGSKSSIFGRAFAFRSPNRFRTSRSRRINSPRSSSFDTISNSVNNLPRSRSDGSVMAPQPLPLPELAVLLRQDAAAASPSNCNATVRLPSPKKNKDAPAPPHSSKCREEREISDAQRHGSGDAVTSISGFSSKNVNQGARRNSEHAAETLASRRSSGRPYGAEKTRSYKLNVPVNMPISSFSSPSLSPGRNSCDILTSHHMSPPGFQAWSAPELPPSDIILGSGQYNQPYEITAISADNSPLNNQKINYGQNAISSYGPISPLHRKTTEASTRRDSNNQTNVHPLPLPPTVSTASQPAPSPKVAAKSEIGKSHWQKGKLIGRGTFGSVYVGSNRETGALCAMKEVELLPDDPKAAECIRQLEQEIQVLRQLKHPNIVQYYGSQTVGDRFYIYLEYVHPGSIVNYIRDHCEAITESVVRNFTRHILSGLAYLHSTKTIHRDIKGANLLVDAYGVVKLADFGMAKHLNGQAANLSLKGSPYWMAPELLQPDMQKDTDPDLALAVDIWSLGCTIIEMMNGKPPWSEYEGPAAMFKVLKETPRIPETLSPEGKDFLQCCFRRNPVERPTASMLLEHRFMKNSQQDRAHHEAGHPIHKHDNVQVSTGAESTKRKVSNSETVRKHRSEVAELKVPPRQPISSTLDALLTSSPSGFGHNMDHPSPSSAAPIPIKQVGRIYRSQ